MTSGEMLIETMWAIPIRDGLAGLSAADAERRMPWPCATHSIAEIVAHMAFWQAWFIGRLQGSGEPAAASAADGWPAVEQGSWPRILQQFLDGLEQAAALDVANIVVDPPFEAPLAGLSAKEAIMHLALHNTHHLGQIITLRQSMGQWPPPAGSFTW
jgi:uncharacterized damage-inducible protein DinB